MSNPIDLTKYSTLPPDKKTKENTALAYAELIEKLVQIQDKLYAQHKYAVLIIIQGIDTAGKDSAVKHVFSGVNPAGCGVKSFKKPTIEENAHHFLWRVNKVCPELGMIQIFNRSHYEDLLMPMLSRTLVGKEIINRYREINEFERGLINNNTIILKYYLHLSHEEQLERIETRRNKPSKRWKYEREDVFDQKKYNNYIKNYELIISKCSETCDWHIIPADRKWYKNFSILYSIVKNLEKYEIEYPVLKLSELDK